MPRHPQHSVKLGLERVANWNCLPAGIDYGTLRPRKSYRNCVTEPDLEKTSLELRNVQLRGLALEPGNSRDAKRNRYTCWRFPLAVGIALAVVALVTLVSMELRLSTLGKATDRAEVHHVSLAFAMRSERRQTAQRLARYRRSIAEIKTELRVLKAEQSKQQSLLLASRHEADHASALLGGQIEDTPLTEEYLSRSPSHLLQPANELGHCWGFYGTRGVAIIRLATPVKVKHVALVHLGGSIAAPRDFKVAGLEGDTQFPIGTFRYDLDLGTERQEFGATANQDRAFQRIRLEVTSNHGHQDTCVYRLQVYGEAQSGVPRRKDKLQGSGEDNQTQQKV